VEFGLIVAVKGLYVCVHARHIYLYTCKHSVNSVSVLRTCKLTAAINATKRYFANLLLNTTLPIHKFLINPVTDC